jgi:glucose/arabinose dehydrogenase
MLFVTEQAGTLKFIDTVTGTIGTVSGVPKVDYGGQGGLGDIAFLPAEAADHVGRRTVYLSWAEAGDGDTRGAVVGKGTLVCAAPTACAIEGLSVIWRQTPKVTGRGHYSHRIAISPDGQHLYIASGERQKMQPAQDTTNTLGTIVRLNLDGTPAAGNPLADKGGVSAEIWSWGHRNILGLDWDAQGRLWEIEHGPAGGDELNLVQRAANYGWPVASRGLDYSGATISPFRQYPGMVDPIAGWTPSIAPSGLAVYRGAMFPEWNGDLLLGALVDRDLRRVRLSPEGRYLGEERLLVNLGERIREVRVAPDGSVWVTTDDAAGKVLRLSR